MSRLAGLVRFAATATVAATAAPSAERFAKLAHKLHVLADDEIGKIQSEASAQGVNLACQLGCDACCHRLVSATLPELLLVADHVRSKFDPEQIAGLRERNARTQQENEPFWGYRSLCQSGPCPFLVDHACTIYEARPNTCRARNSADAELCNQEYVKCQEVDSDALEEQRQIVALNGPVVDGLRQANLTSGTYELAPAVLAILKNRDIAERLHVRHGELEKFKLRSEFAGEGVPFSPAAVAAHRDPNKEAVLAFFASGAISSIVGDGRAGKGLIAADDQGAFESLFRLVLPYQYRTEPEIDEWWERFGEALVRFENARLPARETFELAQMYSTYTLPYTGRNVRPYLQRFMAVLHRCALEAFPNIAGPIEGKRKPGRFRLGIASYGIRNFNGSRWAFGWLRNMPAEIETYVFNLAEKEDSGSQCFRRAADQYLHLPLPISDAAPLIRNCDLDALILTDVGMSGQSIQLAALRLARNQFGAWGHPVTSGSPTMDYYLSSDLMEPPNGDDHYSEKLIRLPGSGLTYPRLNAAPSSKSRSELGLPEDGFLFFAQVPMKLTPRRDALFKEISARSSKPIVFVGSPKGMAENLLEGRLPGIVLPWLPAGDFLRVLQLADASLDSPDWNGGNTTIEALTLGTPVVTLPGEFMRGRHGLAFLTLAGAPGLIARDEADFTDLALKAERRQAAMEGVDADALYEDPKPALALAEILLCLG